MTEKETERFRIQPDQTREEVLGDLDAELKVEPLTEEVDEQQIKIEITDLSVRYAGKDALQSISMDIPRQSVTALLGPSGCGKSTLLRCINRMNDPIRNAAVTGSIKIDGEEIYQNNVDIVELRKRVGMVFQQPNPFPKSIRDNVAYGPRTHGITKATPFKSVLARHEVAVEDEIIETSLKRAALWDEVKDRLDENALGLSGGQQQRLCIARCLAVDPEIILMDEPTSALDPRATLKIEELIRSLAEDYTVVIVTHNLQQAARVADYTAVLLTGGELAEYGETTQVFEHPTNERAENYISGKFG